jgi:histidine triad (HIT) family protein
MEDCLFCKIVKGEIPAAKVYEDEKTLCFKDINPEAPVHVLVIPKKHISNINEISKEDEEIIGHIFSIIKKVTKELGISESGYRIVSNCNDDGGQTVPHVHFHILGGKKLNVPMG